MSTSITKCINSKPTPKNIENLKKYIDLSLVSPKVLEKSYYLTVHTINNGIEAEINGEYQALYLPIIKILPHNLEAPPIYLSYSYYSGTVTAKYSDNIFYEKYFDIDLPILFTENTIDYIYSRGEHLTYIFFTFSIVSDFIPALKHISERIKHDLTSGNYPKLKDYHDTFDIYEDIFKKCYESGLIASGGKYGVFVAHIDYVRHINNIKQF